MTLWEVSLKSSLRHHRRNGHPWPNASPFGHPAPPPLPVSAIGSWGDNDPAASKPASVTTVNDHCGALPGFFNQLAREELVKDNPFSTLRMLGRRSRPVKWCKKRHPVAVRLRLLAEPPPDRCPGMPVMELRPGSVGSPATRHAAQPAPPQPGAARRRDWGRCPPHQSGGVSPC